jgi:acyl-CoA synthetase (AMP-forming)/AMP-acid ligase II
MANLGNLIDLGKDLTKTAIIDDNGAVTYKQLHHMSNYYAKSLQDKGYRPGDRIAVIGLNSIGYVAAYLGILKLGAVAVLINVKLPNTQLEYVLKDSEVSLVITDPKIPLDEEIEFEPYNANDTDPAIILYTSGSTSMPKGVILPHKHLWIINQKSTSHNSHLRRAIVAAPLYHMNGLSNTETVLKSHATMVLMPKFNAAEFIKNIEKHKVNSITSVPTMLTMMLQEKELIESTDFTHVRHVSMASSPVSKSLFSDLKRIFSNAVIQNAYGITEVSPGMFGRHPSKPTPDLSVGYPLPGIDYRIVNGILQVRSPSMLLGYNKIITRNLTEDGYFITNDLFNVDQDGFYFFIGRADDMFVSGGNNVYPRQIETILEEHPLVKNSAVVGLDDDIKGVKPYAFIQGNVSESVIMEYVKTQLPPSHWPRRIWNLDIIPLNSVNKVDKRKLKEVALANLNTICTTQN